MQFRPSLQNQTITIWDWLFTSRHEEKYYKIALHVPGSVRAFHSFACIGAGTGRVGDSENVRSTQHQFRLFININF